MHAVVDFLIDWLTAVQRLGKYMAFSISSIISNTLGCGLLGLLLPDTPAMDWISVTLCGRSRAGYVSGAYSYSLAQTRTGV